MQKVNAFLSLASDTPAFQRHVPEIFNDKTLSADGGFELFESTGHESGEPPLNGMWVDVEMQSSQEH